MDYKEQVARGAELLDKHFFSGSWRERIDKDTLDMRNGSLCILGQLFAAEVPPEDADYPNYDNGYGIGIERFGLSYSSFNEEGCAGFYGFTTLESNHGGWLDLRDAWLAVL